MKHEERCLNAAKDNFLLIYNFMSIPNRPPKGDATRTNNQKDGFINRCILFLCCGK
jgi:hypothetical protein